MQAWKYLVAQFIIKRLGCNHIYNSNKDNKINDLITGPDAHNR